MQHSRELEDWLCGDKQLARYPVKQPCDWERLWGYYPKDPTFPADEKFHFVFCIVSAVTLWKRTGSGKGKFSVMHGESTGRITASTTCLEGWSLSPSFGPMCILPVCLGTKWERPDLKGDQEKGKWDFRDETPAVFPCPEFLDSELAM